MKMQQPSVMLETIFTYKTAFSCYKTDQHKVKKMVIEDWLLTNTNSEVRKLPISRTTVATDKTYRLERE
jgi:hypothetical protein